MLFSVIRFWALGWIDEQYLNSVVQFKYYGFEWVQPLSPIAMYVICFLLGLACLFIMLGFLYRIATIYFFLAFSYCELIDVSYYLNHYYFVSLIGFVLIWLPSNRYFSLDAWFAPSIKANMVPRWTIDIVKFQLGIVYFFAGIAKINEDWLINALPLKIWLPANNHFPVIGFLFNYEWVAYAFSWFGAFYDITVPFFLLFRKTRPFAFIAVICFHLMTGFMFQIGLFPYIMIGSSLIFFSNNGHKRILLFLVNKFKFSHLVDKVHNKNREMFNRWAVSVLGVLFLFQLLFPLRYLLYPGNIFWTEEGYRFSWRVMLMEKAGTATFYVRDVGQVREGVVVNSEFLNSHQEKQMAMQPDLLLQFAHFLDDYYRTKGFVDPVVRVESYVTLNARPSRLLVDPTVDLSEINDSWKPKDWILPL